MSAYKWIVGHKKLNTFNGLNMQQKNTLVCYNLISQVKYFLRGLRENKPVGDITVIIIVAAFPPSDSCSKRVTRESLYGTFPPDFSAVNTFPNALTL